MFNHYYGWEFYITFDWEVLLFEICSVLQSRISSSCQILWVHLWDKCCLDWLIHRLTFFFKWGWGSEILSLIFTTACVQENWSLLWFWFVLSCWGGSVVISIYKSTIHMIMHGILLSSLAWLGWCSFTCWYMKLLDKLTYNRTCLFVNTHQKIAG